MLAHLEELLACQPRAPARALRSLYLAPSVRCRLPPLRRGELRRWGSLPLPYVPHAACTSIVAQGDTRRTPRISTKPAHKEKEK